MSKRIEFTKEQKNKIVKFYEEDLMNPEDIGKIFDCSENPIYRILKERKINTDNSDRHKRLFSFGKIKIWNKGLTKEDPRVWKNVCRGSRKNQFKKGQKPKITGKTFEEFYGEKKAKEMRKKASEIMKGNIPWNKGKPFLAGEKNPIYGTKRSESTRRKISMANKGKLGWSKGLTKETDKRLKQLSETRKKLFKEGKLNYDLENHPQWRGGTSKEPYDKQWTRKFKIFIRKRDNQVCMLCGIHREKLDRALEVHHINYDKKMTLPQNCVSLCLKCHRKTNFSREHWTKFFQSLLAEKYGYKYSETGEIILEINRKV